MTVVKVPVQRVFTSVDLRQYHPTVYHALLVNEVQSELWRCEHRHRHRPVAQECADKERRRWIREGKGRA